MPIYTKTGDLGDTTIAHNVRMVKSSCLISVLGDLDELNAVLGIARLHLKRSDSAHLAQTQRDLFIIGSRIAGFGTAKATKQVLSDRVKSMELNIDVLERKLLKLESFILPFGHTSAVNLHLARAVCRRCERSLIDLKKHKDLIPYLNRLSDYLFVLARHENRRRKIKEETVSSTRQ